MKKILRYTVRIAGTILCLLFLAWIVLAVYVQLHRRSILDRAQNAVKTHLQGDLHIASLEIVHCGKAGHHAPEDRPAEIAAAISAWADRHRLR